ncbi:putative F-box/LRR-repeat protein at5g02930 [Phtheirospermum japonicum]|uniref:Putative F-box/LRR-repeat protein at5g02930 n=1 Tax=Phtheirospermum japonicum TaxID=374723 RepID=A0A830CJ44_9LAMI|nr:putative F-box/LRR-repeat protein at5g02930 [Phtheirospermum japonicum]
MSGERAHKLENEENSSDNKWIKEAPIDRLSALPDSLIIHIISLIGYNVKEAAVTSVLSKRWQFIWSELPRLCFRNRSLEIEKKRDFVSWVGRTLLLRSSGTYLEKFKIDFLYEECFASDLNALVRFAVRSKAKELILMLYSSAHLYTLPQVLYSNSSLRYLHLEQCVVAPRRTINWRSMTALCIQGAELDEHVIHKVLSGCPVLRRLWLMECWGFERLDLYSESLDMLKITDTEDKNGGAPLLEISAPYLRTLSIDFNPVRRKLQLTNVPSLVSVSIHFDVFGNSVEVMNNTVELFENIWHVKDLKLEGACVEVCIDALIFFDVVDKRMTIFHSLSHMQVVSELVVHGQRLPQSRRDFLRLDTSREEDCIPGILGLLESSPNLDTLLIMSYEYCNSYETSVRPWGPIARDDLNCDLLNLKTIRLFDCADPNLGGEPMLTIARILLKRATSLEMMVIDAQNNLIDFSSEFAKISQMVLSYPRSSERAEIVLHQ